MNSNRSNTGSNFELSSSFIEPYNGRIESMIDIIKKKVEVFARLLCALPDVCYVGDPVLYRRAEQATLEEGKRIGAKLGAVLLSYREIAGIGRGFAAPQIGISKAIFVTYVDSVLRIFINPQIVEVSPTKNRYRELCLSSGIMAADVVRPEWIVMQWMDDEGHMHKEKVEGFLARLYQHEEAHLRGIVNLDEAVPHGITMLTFDPLKEVLRADDTV